ncbi:MAG: amidohydrolase family protein [Lachnospiraceae bacterium]|nr:amidohydrolase family protein [Lachnospiraceae bacterium]
MLIDIHTHAYRVKMPFVTPFCTLPELLKEQERLGIDMSVVMPIVSPEIYIPQSTDDIIDMAKEYPDRIIPFCNIDPRSLSNSPMARFEDLMEYYKEKGCKGVGEVMPNMRMDDPKVQNLFRAAEKVGFSVTPDGSDQLDGDFGLYDDPGLPQLELSLRRFPNLIIFGHGPVFWAEIAKLETPGERGVPFRFLDEGQVKLTLPNRGQKIKEEGVVAKLLRRYPNLHCDLSDGTAYNAMVRDVDYISEFIKEFEDRMYFGTDTCAPGQKIPLIDTLKKWKDTGVISKAAYNKITHENAMRLLKL